MLVSVAKAAESKVLNIKPIKVNLTALHCPCFIYKYDVMLVYMPHKLFRLHLTNSQHIYVPWTYSYVSPTSLVLYWRTVYKQHVVRQPCSFPVPSCPFWCRYHSSTLLHDLVRKLFKYRVTSTLERTPIYLHILLIFQTTICLALSRFLGPILCTRLNF